MEDIRTFKFFRAAQTSQITEDKELDCEDDDDVTWPATGPS